jgi:hypothetical protein
MSAINFANIRIDSGFYYLATPYSKWPDGIDDAAKRASIIAAHLIARGLAVFSPIVHAHAIAINGNLDPLRPDLWLPLDMEIGAAAHGLIIAGIEGWETSHGIEEELKWFRARNKPRYLLNTKDLTFAQLT